MKKSIVFFVLVIAVLLTSCPHKSQPQPNIPATGQTNGQGNGQGNDQGTQPAGPGTTEPGTSTPGTTEPGTTESGTTEPEPTPKTYTLTFEKGAEGAVGTMTTQTFTQGVEQAITENAFTYENHEFVGWGNAMGGEKLYDDKATITLDSDLTLYALWSDLKPGETAVTGISLSKDRVYREKDEKVQLYATVFPSDATNKNVTWVSSDENIATITQDGLVTVVSNEVGKATTITAKTANGKTATCVVTVTRVPVATKIGETDWVNISTGSLRLGKEANYHVTLTRSYDICNHEVTQSEWNKIFPDKNPSQNTGDEFPVECVNWYAAIAYCNKLSLTEGRTPCYSVKVNGSEVEWANLTYDAIPVENDANWNAVVCKWDANGYRLPTDAEWEIAARGGKIGDIYPGCEESQLGSYAWHANNSNKATQIVKTKLSNEYWLYDMAGNVWEWAWNVKLWNEKFEDDAIDPTGPTGDYYHSERGGSVNDDGQGDAFQYLKVSYRSSDAASYTNHMVGFRIVRTAK